ncbi:MAG TPA: SMP-30/gluconolactonase/LRE family protein, partial [Anaerolineales bacterium]|nr:SMP-30/gluconolactonase/LRE family protein [Anaerolineales bacterium]
DSTKLSFISALENEPPINRFNDGKCDPAGRFLVGTMDNEEKEPSGSLYSFDGKTMTRLLTNTRISNGLTWSPDYKTFYYIDTPTHLVQAFDYDLKSGQLANSHVEIRVPESLGWPDGMTSDMDGNLWIAMWGGAQVTKWNPNTGQLLEQIHIPAPHSSSCAFGGRDMNELYITSARKDLSADELAKYPHSGGVFRVKTNVTGMPSFEFGS